MELSNPDEDGVQTISDGTRFIVFDKFFKKTSEGFKQEIVSNLKSNFNNFRDLCYRRIGEKEYINIDGLIMWSKTTESDR